MNVTMKLPKKYRSMPFRVSNENTITSHARTCNLREECGRFQQRASIDL